jgi:hypothetical protein
MLLGMSRLRQFFKQSKAIKMMIKILLLMLLPLASFSQTFVKTIITEAIEIPKETKVVRWDKDYTKVVAVVHTQNKKAVHCKDRYSIRTSKKGMVDIIDLPNLRKKTYINGKLLIDKVELLVLTNKETLIFKNI